MEDYYCPCCGKRFKLISKLKYHYRHFHDIGYCPICKKRFASVSTHALNMFVVYGCEEHAVLYWLTTMHHSRSERYRIVKDIIEKYLRGKRKIKWKC